MNHFVSFLIPCYNHEHFVMDLLNSILDQTYTNYEVIICDDNSRDDSVSVIKDAIPLFEKRNIRIKLLVNEENRGIVKNINTMLDYAEGDLIKIIASDDILKAEYLEKMVALFDDDTVKIAFSNCAKYKESGSYPINHDKLMGMVLDPFPKRQTYSFESLFVLNMIPAPSTMIRASVYEELGRYDESIGIEDLEMVLRIFKNYLDACDYLEEILVYYRISENSMSSSVKNKGARKRIKFMYKNQLAIARKYRKDVSVRTYCKRMKDIKLSYLSQLFHLIGD